MDYEIEVVGSEYIVEVKSINLVARFKLVDVDIMTKFIQSLVLNVTSY